MKKNIQVHLNSITADGLIQFQKEAFLSMATTASAFLGVNASGKFVVRHRRSNEEFVFDSPQDAIDKYAELIS